MAAGPGGQPQQARERGGSGRDLIAARAAYQASLDIRVRLAAADPANTGWQRDLSITQHKIKDLENSAEEA